MQPRFFLRRTFSIAALLTTVSTASADVKLHGLFSDHMVLQRNATVPIWGWADEGESVTVEFRGAKTTAVAKNGKWTIRLKKLSAGGPDDLKVTGKNSITLKDVLVGEVWIASGQSNMEWAMRNSYQPDLEIPKTANPMLRLYTVPKLKAEKPVDNVPSSWTACGPDTISNFSAVAYYFGRDLQKALGVPVGMIHTSWGGSPAEVWMREEVLASNPYYKRDILDTYAASKQKNDLAVAAWETEREAAKKAGKDFTKRKPGLAWRPTELYNGMIAPLIPYAIKGAIWYQGESNAERAHQYRSLFADMVSNWRQDWNQGDFAFLQVQLAPFKAIKSDPGESSWAELREAQNYAMKVLPKVGVAVITDVGEEKDIHPRKKEPVGARLALAARHIAYGEKMVWSGPAYKSMKVSGNKATLGFNHVGSGLEARRSTEMEDVTGPALYDQATGKVQRELRGFAVCGEDRKFVWATAEIVGDKVVVSSPQVAKPVAVRYGWADFPVVNLWNREGLPASPFRTDDFPMITAGKK